MKPDMNGSCRISLGLGRQAGLECSRRLMRLRAGGLTLDGMRYSLRLIFWYVSFKFFVSNGGLPMSSVYLQISKGTIHPQQQNDNKKSKMTIVLKAFLLPLISHA